MCSTDLTQELRSSLQSYALCRLLWTPPWWGRCGGIIEMGGWLVPHSKDIFQVGSWAWGSRLGEVRVYGISTRHWHVVDGFWVMTSCMGEPPMRTFVACDMSKVLILFQKLMCRWESFWNSSQNALFWIIRNAKGLHHQLFQGTPMSFVNFCTYTHATSVSSVSDSPLGLMFFHDLLSTAIFFHVYQLIPVVQCP